MQKAANVSCSSRGIQAKTLTRCSLCWFLNKTKFSIRFYRSVNSSSEFAQWSGHPSNPQQSKGEPLPFVVKLLIFCFCCELLSCDLQLHAVFPEQFQSIMSSGSFTDTSWQVRFSQGLRAGLKSAINYCLSIVSDKWRLRTQACNSLGDHVPFRWGLYLHTVTLMNGQVIW